MTKIAWTAVESTLDVDSKEKLLELSRLWNVGPEAIVAASIARVLDDEFLTDDVKQALLRQG